MSVATKVVLPSGRMVLLTKNADPARPWELYESDGVFELRRARRGDSSRSEVYAADRVKPLLFDKADAEALQYILNANSLENRTGKRRGAPKTTG